MSSETIIGFYLIGMGVLVFFRFLWVKKLYEEGEEYLFPQFRWDIFGYSRAVYDNDVLILGVSFGVCLIAGIVLWILGS